MSVKIIMAVCLIPVVFIMFGIMYYEGKCKGNILLGVTLWPKAEQEAGVQGIRRSYRRQMWIWLWVCLGLLFASCFLSPSSIALGLQMLWLLLVIVVFFVPHVRGNCRLKEMKREWTALHGAQETGEERHVDVTAISQTPPRPFWKGGFAGALLGFVPVIGELFFLQESFYDWWTELALMSLAAGGLALLWLMWHFWRMRTDVISWRSQVNQQVARVRQYQWGRFWCLAVWENAAFLFVLWYGFHRPHRLFGIAVAGTLVVSALLLIQMIVTEKNIRKAYEAYADVTYWDDKEDAHWLGGIWYYNEKDSRLLVNKRVGLGTTINLAKTSGKVLVGMACAVMVVTILGVAILLPAYDFVPVSLEVSGKEAVSRQFGEEYRIPIEEMETVELLTELPSMSKRVGTATETIYKGSFLDKEYGSCKACVRRQKPPFVKIITKDGTTYYLNDEEPEETRAAYQEIINRR